ncbi:MAG: GAF and ANTAR domain-containing protein [Actinomycetota bacterium]|nr:GAF and ANTAR domain-containing protein [Actinomycetota bacterium]
MTASCAENLLSEQGVASAIAQAARTINAPRTLDETLVAIAYAAKQSVPGIDAAGISVVHHGGRIETKAATDPLVWTLDALQYDLDEGPCLDAMREQPVVRVENARQEQRWPRYIPRAVEAGLRSQIGVQLYVDEETLGGLNLYSTSSDTLDESSEHVAELFATHAALALGHARHAENLSTAISSRKSIGQAIGILMERYEMDEDRAFQFLVRVSTTGNIKLRDVAQELVDQANTKLPSRD